VLLSSFPVQTAFSILATLRIFLDHYPLREEARFSPAPRRFKPFLISSFLPFFSPCKRILDVFQVWIFYLSFLTLCPHDFSRCSSPPLWLAISRPFPFASQKKRFLRSWRQSLLGNPRLDFSRVARSFDFLFIYSVTDPFRRRPNLLPEVFFPFTV